MHSKLMFNFFLVISFICAASAAQLKRCNNPAPVKPVVPVVPVVPVAPVVPPKPTPPPVTRIETGNPSQPLKNGECFYMVNKQNGQTVTFINDGTIEVGLNGSRTNNEVVCVHVAGPDNYFIHWRRNMGKVFDIYGGGGADGVRLIKWPKHGGANQRFRFIRNSNGDYSFVAVNSGKAFGLYGSGIAQSTPNSGAAQTWSLIPA